MTEWNLVGQLTMGACVPSAVSAVGALDVAVATSLPEVEAKLAGAVAASTAVAVTPVQVSALLEAALAVAVPGVAVSLDAFAGVIAELEATLGTLQAQAAIGVALSAQLGTPGVWLYHVQGNPADIIPGGIPGVSEPVEGVILLGADAGAISAIRSIFGL